MKRGKYERVEAKPQKKANSGLLQTYIISILSLVLCCAMFLSTTFAWFTSDVTSSGNQIYIGILKAGLYHEGVKINDYPEHLVFDNTIKWEPGVSTEETLTIKNEGDLDFNYYLQFLVTANVADTGTKLTDEEVAKIAKCFEVSYREETATVAEEETWIKVTNSIGQVATLAEILEERIPIFKGEMPATEGASKTYKVKLSFKEPSTDESIMGKTLRIDVRLIASQKAQEYTGYNEVELTQTDLTDYPFEPYTVYYLTGDTYTANNGLLINVNNVVLKGNGNTKLTVEGTTLHGQSSVYICGNNVTLSDMAVYSADQGVGGAAVDAIKASGGDDMAGISKNVTLKNLTVSSAGGHGINLHGVEGAVIDGVNIVNYGKAGISLAKATDIKITGCTTPEGMGWAGGCDIACQYSANEGTLYNVPCTFSFDETNHFGNGVVYSERPESATGGRDELTSYPENWILRVGSNGTWALIYQEPVVVATPDELKDALEAGATSISVSGNITLTQSLNATNVTFVGVGENAGIHFNGYNIGGSGTVTYKNLNLTTVSLPDIPANGERYGWYGGIDYTGHSVSNYENCSISGVFTTYSPVVNVTDCTFDYYVQDGKEFYNIFMYAPCKLTATRCTFTYGDRAIKAYSEAFNQYELTLTDCKFVADEGYDISKALINVSNGNLTLSVTNNTVDEALQSLALYKTEGSATVTVK